MTKSIFTKSHYWKYHELLIKKHKTGSSFFKRGFQAMGGFVSSVLKPAVEAPEEVRALYERGLCVPCVGRILSIGRQELESYRLDDVHKSDCFACHGLVSHIDDMKSSIQKTCGRYKFHDIQIEIVPKMIKNDNKLVQQYMCQTSSSIKNYLKGKIQLAFDKVNEGPVLYIKISSPNDIRTELKWPPLYIVGRYYKESRRVSNSRFMKGEYAKSSVEKEVINYLCPEIKCTERKFLSAGREDMDVRMIGSGRPFSVTLLNPLPVENADPPQNFEEFAKTFEQFLPYYKSAESNQEINMDQRFYCGNCVSVSHLKITTKQPNISPKLEKCYRCVVSCSRNVTKENLAHLDNIKDLVISQKTPCRVAHRRILAYREKTVLSLSYRQISPRFFILDLRTSKGTYIKEFVNSDFGRTKPSLGELLDPDNPVECQLLQLDVVFVGD